MISLNLWNCADIRTVLPSTLVTILQRVGMSPDVQRDYAKTASFFRRNVHGISRDYLRMAANFLKISFL